MKLDIHTTDGGTLHIEDFDADTILDLLDDMKDAHVLTFALDDGMAYLPINAITRIDTTD